MWIGTGRHPLSQGIYVSFLNTQTGKLATPVLAAEAVGPGWITLHPSGKVLYAAASHDGKPSIIAYTIDRNNNVPTLKLLNAVEVNDGGATHLSVDPSGGWSCRLNTAEVRSPLIALPQTGRSTNRLS